MTTLDIAALKKQAKLSGRYDKQIARLIKAGIDPKGVELAVLGAATNLEKPGVASIVIYGDPQSGKTEMMICLTAKLLDLGNRTIVHLMNDSVDLFGQSLNRFRNSGLAPGPRSFSDLSTTDNESKSNELVVFCKKNARNLEDTIKSLDAHRPIIVIDDEADYATPNSGINKSKKTSINDLIGQLIGASGKYIGVTATPARLNLNSTFDNDSSRWVQFPAHSKYTGQDTFFPLEDPVKLPYRRRLLESGGAASDARAALVRFMATVGYLNVFENAEEENYTMLCHTSGKKSDHELDRNIIESVVAEVVDVDAPEFEKIALDLFSACKELYPKADANAVVGYIVENISRLNLIVLNSKRDRKAAGENATDPTSPFTIIIGGNIVSRGVTFPNLLSMYFTRTVASKLQQDTYIQRARMFGARGKYLSHFELTIPKGLYLDWHRCFVFHRLALATVKSDLGSPVWLGDKRISVAAKASINKATVAIDKGEMSFGAFTFDSKLDDIVATGPTSIATLAAMQNVIGEDGFPTFLIDYLRAMAKATGTLAIHKSSSIAGSADADQETISRSKSFIGKTQLELAKFGPQAVHHIKIFRNAAGQAKLFYKFRGSIQFMQQNGPLVASPPPTIKVA